MEIATSAILLRLGASIVCGAAIGYERERAGRQAGLRTQLLVSMASATFTIVSTQFVYHQSYAANDFVEVDASRIAASVVSGVGFLGAGAILRTGLGVQGLTTAASLWMTASIGLAAGGGMYVLAAVATLAALVCLIYLRRLEAKQWRLILRRVIVVLDDLPEHAISVMNCLGRHGASVPEIEFDRNLKEHKTRLEVEVRLPDREAVDKLVSELTASAGVWRVKVQRPH
jgi:putative Mg2+ transporter-C (MgtC) family protein